MAITKKSLQDRLAQLRRERNDSPAKASTIAGAIQEIERLIDSLASEKVNRPTPEPVEVALDFEAGERETR